MRKQRNPLAFVLVAMLVTLPFDVYYYLSPFNVLGIAIILGKVVFILLYARRSRVAWHAALALNAAVVPLSLLMIHLGIMPESRHPHRHLFDIAIVVILLLYLWSVRERYFGYVESEI
jgi:hypothetical protein